MSFFIGLFAGGLFTMTIMACLQIIDEEDEFMGKHKDGNGTQKRKYSDHFAKIKDKTKKGKTNKKHR